MNDSSISSAMRDLDAAERKFLLACGWEHRHPHGWGHKIYARRPLTQWDAVMEARRRVVRDLLLQSGASEVR